MLTLLRHRTGGRRRLLNLLTMAAMQMTMHGFPPPRPPHLPPPPVQTFIIPPTNIPPPTMIVAAVPTTPTTPVVVSSLSSGTTLSVKPQIVVAGTFQTSVPGGLIGGHFDGRRMRSKTALRRTVDYNASMINYLQVFVFINIY